MPANTTLHYIGVTIFLLEHGCPTSSTCVTSISRISFEQQGLFTLGSTFIILFSTLVHIGLIIDAIADWSLTIHLLIKLVILSSYKMGFITELIGKMTIENSAYQGVASKTSREWRQQTITNGTQQKKSVATIIEICCCLFLFLFFAFSIFVNLLEDWVEIKLMKI